MFRVNSLLKDAMLILSASLTINVLILCPKIEQFLGPRYLKNSMYFFFEQSLIMNDRIIVLSSQEFLGTP